MQRNPHRLAPARPSPPESRGVLVATFPRARGEELRATLDEYQGRRYARLQVWQCSTSGAAWQVRGKGCSIKPGEVADLTAALARLSEGEWPEFSMSWPILRQPGRK
jgi:hypothetical protein